MSYSEFKVGFYGDYVEVVEDLYIHRIRNNQSTKLDMIPKGSKIYIRYIMYQDNSETQKGSLWGGVNHHRVTGFIDMSHVAPIKIDTSETSTKVRYRVRVNGESLNVLKEPRTNAKVIKVIPQNFALTIVEEWEGWGKLSSGDGWIELERTNKL